tara:strand:- start:4541 stop:5230 length:690 start_codon:yes stop_codon:yes gene_type:complete
MDKLLCNRILRCLDEKIILIFYCSQKSGYIFYVLGTSNFIYKIIVNKRYQSCNCEDYMKHKTLCKHICFVLFKILKIYKISLNTYKISLVGRDSILDTNFFNNYIFPNLDWIIYKNKVNNISKYLKDSFFNLTYYKEFKYYYQQYIFLIYKNLEHSEDACTICLKQINKGITCPMCKKTFHIKCLSTWFSKIEIKKCPICRSDYWNICYKYFILADNIKIPKNLILTTK